MSLDAMEGRWIRVNLGAQLLELATLRGGVGSRPWKGVVGKL
jgi:hypothetical protein